jgi:hypothetical protein
MSLFTSQRGKRLWIFVIIIVLAIYSTLGLALKMADFLQNHDLQDTLFNTLAAVFAVSAIKVLVWFRKWIGKRKEAYLNNDYNTLIYK